MRVSTRNILVGDLLGRNDAATILQLTQVAAYLCSLTSFACGSSWACNLLYFPLDLPQLLQLLGQVCMFSSVMKNSKYTFIHILLYLVDTWPILPTYRDLFICHSVC